MSSRLSIFLALIALLSEGCAMNAHRSVEDGSRTFSQKVSEASSAVKDSWKDVSTTRHEKEHAQSEIEVTRWDWVNAIPDGLVRSELLTPDLPDEFLAMLLPDDNRREIKLVSHDTGKSSTRISKIDGQDINNFDQLQAFIDGLSCAGRETEVELIGQNGKSRSTTSVSAETLLRMSHFAAAETQIMRVNDAGTARVLIRDATIGCKVNARVERQNGLLHLDLSVYVCDENQIPLPHEVVAFADGQPLKCLTVADTLELLYGDPERLDDSSEPETYSFASVSEFDEYLVPSNFKRLQPSPEELSIQTGPRRQPALVSIPGKFYPGPAILGDARALTAFSLQRQLCQPGAADRTGWIMFAGNELKNAEHVELDIDLGHGPQRIRLQMPSN